MITQAGSGPEHQGQSHEAGHMGMCNNIPHFSSNFCNSLIVSNVPPLIFNISNILVMTPDSFPISTLLSSGVVLMQVFCIRA